RRIADRDDPVALDHHGRLAEMLVAGQDIGVVEDGSGGHWASPGKELRQFWAHHAGAVKANSNVGMYACVTSSHGARSPRDGEGPMKYMICWNERTQGSAIEYEKAQRRILDVFRRWEAPANFKIEMFVVRVGDWGGYLLAECDDPTTVHKFCSMLPAFE